MRTTKLAVFMFSGIVSAAALAAGGGTTDGGTYQQTTPGQPTPSSNQGMGTGTGSSMPDAVKGPGSGINDPGIEDDRMRGDRMDNQREGSMGSGGSMEQQDKDWDHDAGTMGTKPGTPMGTSGGGSER